MRVRWTQRAVRDLREIGHYIRRDNPDAARRWMAHLQERANRAADFPQSGRVVPEFQRDDVREVITQGYRIVYRVLTEEIEVVTVFEGHRLFPQGRVAPED